MRISWEGVIQLDMAACVCSETAHTASVAGHDEITRAYHENGDYNEQSRPMPCTLKRRERARQTHGQPLLPVCVDRYM